MPRVPEGDGGKETPNTSSGNEHTEGACLCRNRHYGDLSRNRYSTAVSCLPCLQAVLVRYSPQHGPIKDQLRVEWGVRIDIDIHSSRNGGGLPDVY